MKIVFLGNFSVPYCSEVHHKKSLETLGHEVIALQETQATTEEIFEKTLDADLFVWVHTHGWQTPGKMSMENVLKYLKRANIPSLTYHLDLWLGLKRQEDLEKDPVYKNIEYFFTVDKLMADWFNNETNVKGRYIHAGVFDKECYISNVPSRYSNDVIFVGSKGYHPEWPYRPELINQLTNKFGTKFTHVGGDGQTGTIRGDELNRLYAGSKIAIGDSLCIDFDYPHYWSDRVYETLGRGGFMIHPYIKGMEEDFEDGKHLVFYKFGDFDDLFGKIDYYNEHPEEREKIRKSGHEHVKNNHTYLNRWSEIIAEVTQ